jgi:hypothetical protein
MNKIKQYKSIALFLCLFIIGIYGYHRVSQLFIAVRASQREMITAFAPKMSKPLKSDVNTPTESNTSKEIPSVPSASETETKDQATLSAESEKKFKDVLEYLENKPLISTCQWLVKAESKKKEEQLSFFKRVSPIMKLETILGPMLFQMRLPKYREAILAAEEDPNLIQNVQFAVQLYLVKAELEAHIEEAKKIQLHAYYAWVLSQIVLKNPDLIGDGSLIETCEKFQNFTSPLSQQELNEEVYQLLERSQVKQDEIDFDPQFVPQAQVRWGPQGFTYSASKKVLEKGR